MAEKLTERLIRALKAPKRGARLTYDTELTGFAVRVFAPTKTHPQGARTFLLSYWIDGSERRFRLGSWPGLVGHGGARGSEGGPAADRPRRGPRQRTARAARGADHGRAGRALQSRAPAA
jgi:hypothetical protein